MALHGITSQKKTIFKLFKFTAIQYTRYITWGNTALLLPNSAAQLCCAAPWHYGPTALQHVYNQK